MVETLETISHIVHFVVGAVMSYLHLRNGLGLFIEGHNLALKMSADGVVTVLGATSVVGENVNRSPPSPPVAS
ncbi:hypothetical protein P350_20995 [Burkholderia cepacia JBK9]|uniref:hypothetical protein n=1 Tax=Burkholderia arboris TaxID=488730 RepID=UPI0004D477E0|nr:hypothetical protein [Burkholderia arboris]ALX14068.1 hypothetical protein P350_20995 [Burkholderia cepacia JBK9]MCA8495093.1 hypothetical protein [Burkholderia arboris]